MDIAVITPKAHIKQLLLNRDVKIQMTIADRILEDQELIREYKNLHDLGHNIILDNGASYTGKSIDSTLLVEAANNINANILVLPDSMDNASETIKKSKHFIKYHLSLLSRKIKLMGVVQGKNEDEWISCFFELLKLPEINIIGLGGSIKFLVKNRVSRFKRVDLLNKTLSKLGKYNVIPIHILGAASSGHIEFREFAKIECVLSADTAAPVALAFNNIKMDASKSYDNYTTKIDNYSILNEHQLLMAKYNISVFDEMAK